MSKGPETGRLPGLERALGVVPGVMSFAIIVAPLWLSVSSPWLIAYLVLAFDLYWLWRAASLAGAAAVAQGSVRRTQAIDWNARLSVLGDRPARREALLRELVRVPARPGAVFGFSALATMRSGRSELRDELAGLDAVDALETPPPDPEAYLHVGLVATYTEPLETLRHTVRALAEAAWPTERKICAILTRRDDEGGKANVDVLRAEYGSAFAAFLHVIDPREPGIAIAASSTMVIGCRQLYRILVHERGWDPRRVLVTNLEADERVDPQHFAYLTWAHLSSEDRETQLYQPVSYLDNGLWRASALHRLPAAVLSHRQLARTRVSSRSRGFGTYAATLQLVHEVGYWATNAMLDDVRLSWRAYVAHGERFRVVPLGIPVHGDAARTWQQLRSVAAGYGQARRWLRGPRDLSYVVPYALGRAEIPFASRARRFLGLLAEHARWAITPVVVVGGTLGLLGAAFAGADLHGALPTAVGIMAVLALAAMVPLIWVELRTRPAYPASWGIVRRGLSHLPWIGLPVVGVLLSMLSAPDGGTPPPVARYRARQGAETA